MPMTTLASELIFPAVAYRLRPGVVAEARGFAEVSVEFPNQEPYRIPIPVAAGLNLILRFAHPSAKVWASDGDFLIERLNWLDSAVAALRTKLTTLSRSVLKFDRIDVFPEGSRAKTRRFRKQVEIGKRWGISFDNRIIREHPELLEGWRAKNPTAISSAIQSNDNTKIGVVTHLYYTDIWPEIECMLLGLDTRFTLFVTLPSNDAALEERINRSFPGTKIRVVENRGRDVRPFLLMLEEGVFDACDLVCKIHSKRSLGGGRIPIFGEIMRRAAFLDLISSSAQVRRIIDLFETNPAIGLVGPRRFLSKSTANSPFDVLGPADRWLSNTHPEWATRLIARNLISLRELCSGFVRERSNQFAD